MSEVIFGSFRSLRSGLLFFWGLSAWLSLMSKANLQKPLPRRKVFKLSKHGDLASGKTGAKREEEMKYMET